MEPLDDYLSRALYKSEPKYNREIYGTKERLMKLIKQKKIEESRELLGGNKGIHLPNEE